MTHKKTLVLGASLKPHRYSHLAIQKLVANNIPTVAIGLRQGIVDGVEVHTTKPQFKDIDTVTLYLNASRQEEYYGYIISLKPKRVIFNPGTQNHFFEELLRKEGIFLENACTLVMLTCKNY
ncbi:MAG: CoA-binding protein [Cytophagaceae bacterium]|nr:CoA-binding protein [Cytophagaceae bacterium]|tara:strand:+ start:3632 stop:3997 length:366 start_codon:yes stop_codon:yes gene_type:complete